MLSLCCDTTCFCTWGEYLIPRLAAPSLNFLFLTSQRERLKELEPPVPGLPSSPLITTVETFAGFTPAFCFPCKYFSSISQQICHSETQRRNASVATTEMLHSRLLSSAGCRAAASKRPLFISHLVVWGVTARPAESIIPSPRPPPSPLDCLPLLRGCVRCLMSTAPGDNAPLDL